MVKLRCAYVGRCFVKSYSGGVRHDYKDSDVPARARNFSVDSLIPDLNRRSVH